jgi:hypothetical protein
LSVYGFSQNQDVNTWTGMSVSKDLNKKFTLAYEMQTRFYKNSTTLKTYLNQVGLEYELVEGLDASFEYRFSRKKKDYYFLSENRFMLNLSYGYKIDPANIKLSVRARFQNEFDRLKVINNFIKPTIENKFRIKFTVKYKNPDFKLIQPFLAYELFSVLGNSTSLVSRNRFIGGLGIDLKKGHGVKIYYINQTDLDSPLEKNHIYSIQYSYNLDKIFYNLDKIFKDND